MSDGVEVGFSSQYTKANGNLLTLYIIKDRKNFKKKKTPKRKLDNGEQIQLCY